MIVLGIGIGIVIGVILMGIIQGGAIEDRDKRIRQLEDLRGKVK